MEDRTRQSKTRSSRNTTSKSTSSSSSSSSNRTNNKQTSSGGDLQKTDETLTENQESSKLQRRSSRKISSSISATPSAIATAQSPSTPILRLPSTTSTQSIRRSSRPSSASENSSSYSHTGTSPLSTSATNSSIASNVSTSSTLPKERGKKTKEVSKATLTGHSPSEANTSKQNSKGKAKASASISFASPSTSASSSSSGSSSSSKKGKKRARSASPVASVPPNQPKKRSRKSEPIPSSKYSLRPRPKVMANVNKEEDGDGVAAAANKSNDDLVKGKSTRTKSKANTTSDMNVAATSSCMVVDEGAMEVDVVNSRNVDEEDINEAGEDEQEVEVEEEEEEEEENEDDEEARRIAELDQQEQEGDEDEDEDAHYDDEMGDPYGDSSEGGGAFGVHLRAMAGYMSGLSGRFRTLLASIRDRKNPSSQLVALQELSEVLSISNEDTLAGYFPTENFVTELIYLMGGPKPINNSTLASGESSKSAKDTQEEEEDEMAAAIAAAAGLEDNGEKMLLACRCLANLIEAMPYAAHSVVSLGAIPVLNSKLMEIEFIDLAEQVLQTLEKISGEYPSAIVREDGMQAMLQYLDFFNIHVQRTAMNAAANCCRRMSADSFQKVKEVLPIIKNVLSYSDQRLVESACRCIVRLVESFRHQGELLEQVLTDEMVASINAILLPASISTTSLSSSSSSASTTVNTTTYTDVLKALGVAARVSPKTAVTLLENNVVETLYHLLTGSPAPDEDGQGGKGPAVSSSTFQEEEEKNTGAAVAVLQGNGSETVADADVAVLQNLAHRPKEQVQEALSLVAELLPPLPRSGVFDPRMYTEKAYLKRKAKIAKAAKLAKEVEKNSQHRAILMEKTASEESIVEQTEVVEVMPPLKQEKMKSDREIAKEQAQAKRVETLKDRQGLVKRFTQLVLPTLVEVYAASVALHVRSKALFGILKIVSFVEPEPLMEALDNVALASFIAAILSSRDHPTLIQGALQLVEMLTIKLPSVYSALLRREGVMWEIEDIASKNPTNKAAAKTTKAVSNSTPAETVTPIVLPGAVPTGQGVERNLANNGSLSNTSALPSSDLSRLLAGAGVQSLGRLAGRLPASGGTGMTSGGHVGTTLLSVSGQPITVVEAEDSNIWRARILRDQLSPEASKASLGGADEAGRALDEIKDLVKKLETTCTSDQIVAEKTLQKIAILFAKADNPISSFELLRSGMVDGLYTFAVGDSFEVPRKQRRLLLLQTLMQYQGQNSGAMMAASALTRRLQETLSRLESFDITTAINNPADETRRSPTANVARQIRLKLIADNEDGDIPKNCTNLIVSIHAITSFQSLNDYLRPKIAASQAMSSLSGATSASEGGLGSASNLSGALAAFASSAGFELYPSLRTSLAAAAASSSTNTNTTTAPAAAQSSTSDAIKNQKRASASLSEVKDEPDPSTMSGKNTEPSSSKAGIRKGKKTNEETGKRRSSRLSAKVEEEEAKGQEHQLKKGEETEDVDDKMDEALARRLVEGLLQDEMEGLEDEGGFTDEDDYDEEDIIEDGTIPGMEPTGSSADRTIHLNVAQDGSKVEAKTPDGTRVATPINELSRSAPASSSTMIPTPTGKASYASALQKRPTDWHLEFQMEGRDISLDSTIYSAIHRYEMQRQATSKEEGQSVAPRYIWSNTYTVKFRKVNGPIPSSKETELSSSSALALDFATGSAVELPASIAKDASYARILQLLRVLYDLNSEWRADKVHHSLEVNVNKGLTEASFVNNKLTAKLNRQLEEPMIVASNCMPEWSLDLPRSFPFLFPFEVRYAFLQSTSFGYHRLINKWQNQQSRNQETSTSSSGNSRHDDSLALLGRLTRQKVRISRNNILASAFKVFELYGTNTSLLEVEYFDEVGTGLGPTLEFYALVSKEFARRDLQLWRSDDVAADQGDYVFCPGGLFPAPVDAAMLESAKGKTKLQSFKVLGQFVAKALFDSRIVDLHFSNTFMRGVICHSIPETLSMLKTVDSALAQSLEKLSKMNGEDLDGLNLDFTLPGQSDYELHKDGQNEAVNKDNVEQYIQEVIHQSLVQGVAPLIEAFRQGFNMIFPIAAMSIFKEEELVMLFGNNDEDWSESTLMSSIKPDHGYHADSPTFRDIISIMSQFSTEERRDFLQWLTGSPKLPIGGFLGLHPPLTIVKRPPEANVDPDKTLPSVMTCVNFCKLPPFSSKTIMKERLLLAMKEGQASFHLS